MRRILLVCHGKDAFEGAFDPIEACADAFLDYLEDESP
jgi:hypothetical protein